MALFRSVARLGFVVLVLLSGCITLAPPAIDNGVAAEADPDPDEVFDGAFVHSDDLEDVHGNQTTIVSTENGTHTEVVRVSERPYVDFRSEVLESSVSDRVGEQYVSNASASWWYDPKSNTASVFEPDDPFDNEAVRDARADEADRQRDLYDLEYQGTETVAGREAHVLSATAKNESVVDEISLLVGDTEFVYALETVDPSEELDITEQTIWIDTEYKYPLQEELVVNGTDDDQYVMTERFETIEFNTDLSDDRFAFEPPENATVEELN
ncbi:LolA family protein [Halopiger djelfimassiliensis]|uniref:LolA family protein n=1 Tax=Halopiger djelfimassiliensis TaxID=1293047 RepID=UPI000677FDED|nr:outer membrane lipoprotein carrier protein LolA [Halopiger djelfimassiliensis]